VAERESQVVLGLDPDLQALWPAAEPDTRAAGSAAERAAAAVLEHCREVIDATAAACVAVKFQLARFEVLGAAGWAALAAAVEHARERGLLVIADGKRGDIELTARAYAHALSGELDTPFGGVPGLGADLVTVNPLLGGDGVEPFVSVARAAGRGVLVLVRTSNPGAADIQDLRLQGGGTVWERIARLVAEQGAAGTGAAGLSDVGARADEQRAVPAARRGRAGGASGEPCRSLPPGSRGRPDRGFEEHRRRLPRRRRRARRRGARRGRAAARGGLGAERLSAIHARVSLPRLARAIRAIDTRASL
jgi:orotidine-5'-phosphate decarboxylase